MGGGARKKKRLYWKQKMKIIQPGTCAAVCVYTTWIPWAASARPQSWCV